MPILTVPYNFVPLNETVVRPDWADEISLDLPFQDGLSGRIDIKIESDGPIYVRNSGGKEKQDTAFSKTPDGRFFIPGSSLRGAIRNVLSIASFGDLGRHIGSQSFSYRDVSHPRYKKEINEGIPIRGAWLSYSKENDSYIFSDIHEYAKISHRALADITGWEMFRKLESKDFSDYKTAQAKYAAQPAGVKYFEIDGRVLIMTGQPAKSEPQGRSKHHEFLFEPYSGQGKVAFSSDSELIKNFKYAYYDHDPKNRSKDYERCMKLLKEGERVPVFVKPKEGNSNSLHSFGLSQLYKFPYKNTAKERINNIQSSNDISTPDLAECIFGHVLGSNNSNQVSLKGRVSFGHAIICSQSAESSQEVEAILSSPKPTYYPTYIRQTDLRGGYKDLSDNDSIPSGWKRYPIHKNGVETEPEPESEKDNKNKKISTHFTPISEANFKGTVAFHNLRPVELGALLSALSFHGNENAYHSLGMAKPLGYGKVKIRIEGIEFSNESEGAAAGIDDLMRTFEEYMNMQLGMAWHKTEQIVELLTMATGQANGGNSELKYMAKVDDFAEVKRSVPPQALKKYSQLDSIIKQTPISKGSGQEKGSIDKAQPKDFFFDKIGEIIRQKREEGEKQKEETERQRLEDFDRKEAERREKAKADLANKQQERAEKGLSVLTPEVTWERGKGIIMRYLEVKKEDKLDSHEVKMVSDWMQSQKKVRDLLKDVKAWPENRAKNATFRKICTWMEEAEAEEIMNKLKTN